MLPSQVNTTTRGPLSPLNLLLAGVSPREVVWFRSLGPGAQMRSLQSERGQALLNKVRAHQERASIGSAMPMPA